MFQRHLRHILGLVDKTIYLKCFLELLFLDKLDLKLANVLEISSVHFVNKPDIEQKVPVVGHGDWVAESVSDGHPVEVDSLVRVDHMLLFSVDLVRNGGNIFPGVALACHVERTLSQGRKHGEELLESIVKVIGNHLLVGGET